MAGGMTTMAAAAVLLACAAASAAAAWSPPPPPPPDDLDVVRQRVVQSMLLAESDLASAREAAAALGRALRPNGTWADIDYHDFRAAGWPMEEHLSRMVSMAKAWRGSSASAPVDGGTAQATLLTDTTRALEAWLLHDWKNTWYDNMISVPSNMGAAALLLSPPESPEALSAPDGNKMVEIMARAHWADYTGANLLNMLRVQVYRGVFAHNSTVVAQAFARAFQDVCHHHQDKESIQADNSFHQHGTQLESGGYGATFASIILSLAVVSGGTAFAMPADKLSVFEGLVLDGQARMTRGGSWDWQVTGRAVSTPSLMKIRLGSTSDMRRFGDAVSLTRKREWEALARRIDTGDASADAALVGTTAFYNSDYLAHNRPEYLFSIHMFSKRTIPAACINEQGKQDRHLSDGATALYKTGHEYAADPAATNSSGPPGMNSSWTAEVFPVWNWSRPPGTTTATASVAPRCDNAKKKTDLEFVGSVSGGTVGVAMQSLDLGVPAANITAAATNAPLLSIKNCSGKVSGDLCCPNKCRVCGGPGCLSKDCCNSGVHRHCSATVGPPCRFNGPPPPPHAIANKSWLLFEDAILASGEVQRPQTGALVTTIEQSRLQGSVLIGQSLEPTEVAGNQGDELESAVASTLPPNSTRALDLSQGGAWVLHHGTGYVLPQTPGVVAYVSNDYKTGSWRSVGVGSEALIALPLFDLYLVHEQQYRYWILPINATAASMPASLESSGGYVVTGGGASGFTLATNNDSLHAADKVSTVLGAVWTEGGTTATVGCLTINASRACAFVLRRWANGTLSASASVPGANGGNLSLAITHHACDGGEWSVAADSDGEPGCVRDASGDLSLHFQLPSGDYLGKSVDVVCAGVGT